MSSGYYIGEHRYRDQFFRKHTLENAAAVLTAGQTVRSWQGLKRQGEVGRTACFVQGWESHE